MAAPFRFGIFCTASLALALLSAPGCRKERGHSKAFDEATALFRKVYAEKLDSAFDDPRMMEVERLLAVVPPQSVDAPAAQELRQRITAGRAALRAGEEPEVEPEAPREDPWANWKPEPAAVPDAGPPDAGYPHPDVGMTIEELRSRFSDCFAFKQSVRAPNGGRHDAWEMKSSEACLKAHPGYEKYLVILDAAGQKIRGFAPATAVETRYYYADGGEAPPPPPKP